MERGESHVPAFLRPVFVRLPDLRFGSRAVILAARKSRRLCLRKEISATPARFVASGPGAAFAPSLIVSDLTGVALED